MNVYLDNVNLGETTGPNSFGTKLHKYIQREGVTFDYSSDPDVILCFIQSNIIHSAPMVQRLDGIYFNIRQNYKEQNKFIKQTYDKSDGIIFQSEFNKNLIFKFFGPKEKHVIIHNGSDLEMISEIKPVTIDKYENIWSCASAWRPHKRLKDNIRYFLEHSNEKEGLVVAGNVNFQDVIRHDRIHYVGHLLPTQPNQVTRERAPKEIRRGSHRKSCKAHPCHRP